MKKLFIAVIAVIALASSSFAADGNKKASYWVLDQFNQTYSQATDVQWTVGNEFAKANFILDGMKVEAYYNQLDGTFIGQSKAVPTEYLPKNALRSINRKYSNYTMKEVFEFSSAIEVDFFVSLENDAQKLVLKISRSGEISIFKTTNK
jgi:hypothetical protein